MEFNGVQTILLLNYGKLVIAICVVCTLNKVWLAFNPHIEILKLTVSLKIDTDHTAFSIPHFERVTIRIQLEVADVPFLAIICLDKVVRGHLIIHLSLFKR